MTGCLVNNVPVINRRQFKSFQAKSVIRVTQWVFICFVKLAQVNEFYPYRFCADEVDFRDQNHFTRGRLAYWTLILQTTEQALNTAKR